jgi:hypothetical protein
MSFLIDTDICSAHLRDVHRVTNCFSQYSRFGRRGLAGIVSGITHPFYSYNR